MSNHRRTARIMGYIGERCFKTGEMILATDYLNQCLDLSTRHGVSSDMEQFLKILDQIKV